MRQRFSRSVRWVLVAGSILIGSLAAAGRPDPAPMAAIADAVGTLLTAGAGAGGLGEPAVRSEVEQGFAALDAGSRALSAHARRRDADFQVWSTGLEVDVRRAGAAFESGNFELAEDLIYRATHYCSGCHAKLPAPGAASLGADWIERVGLDDLPRPEQARLLVAVRRFDDALSAWEAELADPAVPPMKSDVAGWLTDYLAVAIRTTRQPERPLAAVQRLAARSDTPRYLRLQLAHWADSLEVLLEEPPSSGSPVARGRALIERGHEFSHDSSSRDALVFDLAASGELFRWLDANPGLAAPPARRAEAWYLLASIEDRVNLLRGRGRAEWFMEHALRAEPGGPFADAAFARLEVAALIQSGVFRRDELPRKEALWLDQLEALVAALPVAREDSP